MIALLALLAVIAAVIVFALGLARAAAVGDRQRETAVALRRGDVVDIGTARRRRNGAALARRGGDVA